MTRVPTLYPGESIVIAATIFNPSFFEFQAEMLRKVAEACGLTLAEQGRLIGAKQCLSCGAYQSVDGALPCDH